MAFNPTYSSIENEGCNLHYWYIGQGPLLLFIPGGTGHGFQYNKIMSILSASYTCCTFDRRGFSSSTLISGPPKPLSPPLQARDIVSIIHALKFKKAIIFGNSLGGTLAFQLAIDFPDVIDHLICHEAPIIMLLPDSSQRVENVFRLYQLSKESGLAAAFQAYMPNFKGYDDEGIDKPTNPPMENAINFFENEFVIGSLYNPDWRRVKGSVGVMAGERSKDAFYARSTIEQESILGCVRMVVPGHHAGFDVEAEAFVPALKEMIGRLEERRAQK